MKNSNEVRLSLEVLEDRVALNGAFGGAISAGVPLFPASPYTVVAVPPAAVGTQQTGFRSSIPSLNNQLLNQATAFQNQLQSFQAAQMAAIDQFFSEVQSLLQQLNIHSVFVF